jgi:LPXTG-site transpeptidase (sortase) family protein
MRNIGIIIILVIFGMSLWKASDQYQPVGSEPSVSEAQTVLAVAGAATSIELQSIPIPVEKESLDPEGPDQPEMLSEIAAVETSTMATESSTAAVKPRQKIKSTRETEKSFDQIIIPSLKLNAPVVSKPYSELSWDLTTLGQDVALLGNIPNQTSDNNVVMAGHVTVHNGSNGPFRYLWRLVPGDQILLEDDYFTYTYTVREQVLVYPDETSVLEDSQSQQLTLITCTTWDEETLSYLRRRVIVADLESVELRQIRME